MNDLIIHSYSTSSAVVKTKFKEMFKEAFIKSERMSVFLMNLLSLKNDVVFNVITDTKDNVLGFYYVYSKDGILFLYYLAVAKEYRGNGVGYKILTSLETEFSLNSQSEFYVIAESVREGEEISNIKKRRCDFYTRFGFELTDYIVCDKSGPYDLYKRSAIKDVDVKRIRKILKRLNPLETCNIHKCRQCVTNTP